MERLFVSTILILMVVIVNVQSSPMWLLMDEHEPKLPPELDFVNIFESKLDKVNRYRHLHDLMQSAIIAIDRYEERILDEIVALEQELPFLREMRRSDSGEQPSRQLQPRTLIKGNEKNAQPKLDFLPLRKRKNQLSVDLTLQTLKDMIASEEGRKRKESNLGYSASRLLRAGRK